MASNILIIKQKKPAALLWSGQGEKFEGKRGKTFPSHLEVKFGRYEKSRDNMLSD